jgi:transposase
MSPSKIHHAEFLLASILKHCSIASCVERFGLKPYVFGMSERNDDVVIHMLPNVQQQTIKPYVVASIASATLVYTDEYTIYCRLSEWGYGHKIVNHGASEYARDEDNDGFHEGHVNTIEEFWSLL